MYRGPLHLYVMLSECLWALHLAHRTRAALYSKGRNRLKEDFFFCSGFLCHEFSWYFGLFQLLTAVGIPFEQLYLHWH